VIILYLLLWLEVRLLLKLIFLLCFVEAKSSVMHFSFKNTLYLVKLHFIRVNKTAGKEIFISKLGVFYMSLRIALYLYSIPMGLKPGSCVLLTKGENPSCYV